MFKLFLTLFLFATAALAQNVFIATPNFNDTVKRGDKLDVQVQRPNSLTGSEEVAVVVGIQSCPNRPCTDPTEYLGAILYNGHYDPEYHEQDLPPYQNITVVIPASIPTGTALLGVSHVSLIGAGNYPNLETLNQTITVT